MYCRDITSKQIRVCNIDTVVNVFLNDPILKRHKHEMSICILNHLFGKLFVNDQN